MAMELDAFPMPTLEIPVQTCKKCTLPIYEGHAYELGDDRWHIPCFKCSKCNLLLGCNLNFLVLGNGSLICLSCSYNCKQCGKKIDDLAILTGDQAYCSLCFKCRSCKEKIEDLRYARTSKGLFCMNCHEKLVAKKKKHDMRKRQLAKQQEDLQLESKRSNDYHGDQNSTQMSDVASQGHTQGQQQGQQQGQPQSHQQSQQGQHYNPHSHLTQNSSYSEERPVKSSRYLQMLINSTQNSNHSNSFQSNYITTVHSNRSLSSVNKSLPPPPPSLVQQPTTSLGSGPGAKNTIANNLATNTLTTTQAARHSNSTQSMQTMTTALTQTPNSEYETPVFDAFSKTDKAKSSVSPDNFSIEEVNDSDEELEKSMLQNDSARRKRPEHSPTPPLESSSRPSTPNLMLQPAVDLSVPTAPTNSTESSNLLISKEEDNHRQKLKKNVLLYLPSQFHDNEFHPTQRTPLLETFADTENNLNHLNSNNQASLNVEDSRFRNGSTSPYAKSNRQARVVETNDNVSMSDLSDTGFETPRRTGNSRGTNLLSGLNNLSNLNLNNLNLNDLNLNNLNHHLMVSPPPNVPVPSTPKRKEDIPQSASSIAKMLGTDLLDTPRGLGLEGVSYYNDKDYFSNYLLPKSGQTLVRHTNPTPAVTNLEDEYSQTNGGSSGSSGAMENAAFSTTTASTSVGSTPKDLGRMSSILRTPKFHHKHKRLISGGSQSKFGFFSKKGDDGASIRSHSRNFSEGLTSVYNQQYTTPPINSTATVGGDDGTPFGRLDLETRLAKLEVYQLESQRQLLEKDIKKLAIEKSQLIEESKELKDKISYDSKVHESLSQEIHDMQMLRKRLTEENAKLQDKQVRLRSNQFNESLDQNTTIGTAYSSMVASDDIVEEMETQKATKLKFWRRPKLGFQPGTTNPQGQIMNNNNSNGTPMLQQNSNGSVNGSNNNGGSKMTSSFSSYGLKQQASGSGTNGSLNFSGSNENINGNQLDKFGSGMMSKSRSTNILDTLLSGNSENKPNQSLADIVGSSLFKLTLSERASYENEEIPMIISRCIGEVERRGLDIEGIYRISGGNLAIVAIENAFDSLPPNSRKDSKLMMKLDESVNGDINAVTLALKRYLRKLPDPIIPYDLYDEFIKVSVDNPPAKQDKRIKDLRALILKLPKTNKTTLETICKHLNLVNQYLHVNRMGFRNLLVVFAPTLVRDQTGEKEMIDMGYRNDVMDLMLLNYNRIFC